MSNRSRGLIVAMLGALLFTAIVRPVPAADTSSPAQQKQPHNLDLGPVAHDAWGNNPEQVRAILASAANELWRHFANRPLKPILVEPKGGPITLFDRGPGGEYRVRLDTGDNLWAQWAFQFAHEFGHILSNYDEVKHQNKWFEETICEVASLFVLQRLADTWSKDPSPASWKKYAQSMRKYAETRIAKAKLAEGMTLPQWYEANARLLAKTGYDREKNNVAAVQLLPLFEKSPEHWEAIGFLAKAKQGHTESLADFLKAWQTHCPEKHRPFIAGIAEKFALDLDKVKPGPAKEENRRD